MLIPENLNKSLFDPGRVAEQFDFEFTTVQHSGQDYLCDRYCIKEPSTFAPNLLPCLLSIRLEAGKQNTHLPRLTCLLSE